ncbi:acyl carrier protein [Streptomyces sp. NPDC097619]|uniref:acyl carrier protein n=1 Tax=Streptomyces sp. NPDC097619 TaxID=3157228 RepID=UPI00332AC831
METSTPSPRTHLLTTLTEKFEIPADQLSPEATLGELGMDSLAIIELYVTLQDHWAVPLDDSAAGPEITVGELGSTLTGLLSDRAGQRDTGHHGAGS